MCNCLHQLSLRHHHHAPADIYLKRSVLVGGFQEQQRRALNLIALFHMYVNRVTPEIAVLDQITGQAAVRTARGWVFGDALGVGEPTRVQLILRTDRLGTERQHRGGISPHRPLHEYIPVRFEIPHDLQMSQRDHQERDAG